MLFLSLYEKSCERNFLDLPNITNHQGKMVEYDDATNPTKLDTTSKRYFYQT
jgi:hypothetical protein